MLCFVFISVSRVKHDSGVKERGGTCLKRKYLPRLHEILLSSGAEQQRFHWRFHFKDGTGAPGNFLIKENTSMGYLQILLTLTGAQILFRGQVFYLVLLLLGTIPVCVYLVKVMTIAYWQLKNLTIIYCYTQCSVEQIFIKGRNRWFSLKGNKSQYSFVEPKLFLSL